jgi:hypothetical protein
VSVKCAERRRSCSEVTDISPFRIMNGHSGEELPDKSAVTGK